MIGTPSNEVPEEDDQESDGRRLRAARNRDAVVTAVLAIIREQGGGPMPGAAEVAARAGVSERTVFRHFADLESLFVAGAAQQRPVVRSFLAPRPADKELDKRIAAIARLRAKLWEHVAPVRRAALRAVANDPSLGRQIAEANRVARQQVAEVFAPEIERAGSDKGLVLDQLDVVTGFSSWETLRRDIGASPERARRVMTTLMTAVLEPYGGRRRGR